MEFCNCKDWSDFSKRETDLISYSKPHNSWALSWLNISPSKSTAVVHRYAVLINNCPFCGNKLKNNL